MLSFDPVEHRYQFDGVDVPNVTRVLEDAGMLRLGGLYGDRLVALAIGKAVHLATELHDQNDLDEASVDDVVVGYLNAWKRLMAETGLVIEAVEQRVYHPLFRYAGQLDRLGRLPKCGGVIVDIKSGVEQRATGPQLDAYRNALPKSEQKRKRFGAYLHRDGTYHLVPYVNWNDFAVFTSALSVYNWKRA